MANPFSNIFDFEHVLTPIAGEVRRHKGRKVLYIYIFGVRVLYLNISK